MLGQISVLLCEKLNHSFCNNFVKNSIAFCQNKTIPNKVISLNLSVTSPVIHRIPMFVVFSSTQKAKMVLCLMVDCSNRSGRDKVSFNRVPTVIK